LDTESTIRAALVEAAVQKIADTVERLVLTAANGATVTSEVLLTILPRVLELTEIPSLSGAEKQRVAIAALVVVLQKVPDFPGRALLIDMVRTTLPMTINLLVAATKGLININLKDVSCCGLKCSK
jgi:ABC-type hemin transport system ATPase subunit